MRLPPQRTASWANPRAGRPRDPRRRGPARRRPPGAAAARPGRCSPRRRALETEDLAAVEAGRPLPRARPVRGAGGRRPGGRRRRRAARPAPGRSRSGEPSRRRRGSRGRPARGVRPGGRALGGQAHRAPPGGRRRAAGGARRRRGGTCASNSRGCSRPSTPCARRSTAPRRRSPRLRRAATRSRAHRRDDPKVDGFELLARAGKSAHAAPAGDRAVGARGRGGDDPRVSTPERTTTWSNHSPAPSLLRPRPGTT